MIGFYGARAADALIGAGLEPSWSTESVVFAGAPVWNSECGNVTVSGEVILDNEADLRRLLGRNTATSGGLLAELYACHGLDAGRFALGMYAVAIWDARSHRLVLLRDGVGARTLYYAATGRGCWFATRLRAVRRCPGVSGELSLPALRDYLTCAFVPGEQTLYRDVREVRPGETVAFPGGARRTYWAPGWHSSGSGDPEEQDGMEPHARGVRALLADAVQASLTSSGRIGVLLSGGLDSSIVTALAAQQAPGRIHTFAIHFGAEHPNELEFSRLVARHCGTEHHVVELPGRQIRDTLVETMGVLDDPIGDPLTTPNLMLAKAVRGYASVTLNGEGGDPCFGGPKNLPMLLHELYAPQEPRAVAYLRSFQKCYDDLPSLLAPDVQSALACEPAQESIVERYFDSSGGESYLDCLMRINVQMKGADQILTKVNNIGGAIGLLARSPFFDRRVVDAAFAVPPGHKLAGAVEKAVLKAAFADVLPEAILRRPKSGMLVPVQRWFRRDLRSYSRGMLLSRRARIRPYLNQALIREWLDYRGAGWPRQGVKLWLVLALEAWLRAHEG